MGNYKKAARSKHRADIISKQEDVTDQVLAYERFRTEIAPELQEMLLRGASDKEILSKYKSYAAAKILSIALTEDDAGKALAAAKDILDRSSGKAVERKKVEHSMADMEERDLDALLASELEELDEIEAEYKEIDDVESEDS